MDNITLFLIIIVAGLAGLLLFVSLVSWNRVRSIKIALVTCAFGAFFIKALLLLAGIISQDAFALVIDVIVLVLLYFAVIKT